MSQPALLWGQKGCWVSLAPWQAGSRNRQGCCPREALGVCLLPAVSQKWGLVQTKRCFQKAEINNTNPNLKLY